VSRHVRGGWLGVAAVTITLLGSGCARSPAVPVDVTPAPTETPAPAAGNLPPGCAPIDLRAPSGERIELDGTWTEVGTTGQLMTWRIRTQGNCVWGAGSIEDAPPEGALDARPADVQSLAGVLQSDFVITGEIILLGADPPGVPLNQPPYSPLRMFVEFDEAGEILLREDREPGASGLRCPEPSGYCPAPLLLRRVD
jgi:hypothetical protein